MSTWDLTDVPKALVSLFSTTSKMHATPSSSSTATNGKAAHLRFAKTATLAVVEEEVSGVVAASREVVEASGAEADLMAVEAVDSKVEVASREASEVVEAAIKVVGAVTRAVEVVAIRAEEATMHQLMLLLTHSPTALDLAPSLVQSSTCAT